MCLCEGLWRQSYRKKVVNSFVRTIFSNKMKSICLVKWCPHCIFNILLFSRGEFCIEIIDTSIMNMLIGKWHKMTHFLSIFCKIENKKTFRPTSTENVSIMKLVAWFSATRLKVLPITNTWSQWKEIENWDWSIERKFVQDRHRVFKSYWVVRHSKLLLIALVIVQKNNYWNVNHFDL